MLFLRCEIAKRGAHLLRGQPIGVADRVHDIASGQMANDLRDEDAYVRDDGLAMHNRWINRHARMPAPCETVLSPPLI